MGRFDHSLILIIISQLEKINTLVTVMNTY